MSWQVITLAAVLVIIPGAITGLAVYAYAQWRPRMGGAETIALVLVAFHLFTGLYIAFVDLLHAAVRLW